MEITGSVELKINSNDHGGSFISFASFMLIVTDWLPPQIISVFNWSFRSLCIGSNWFSCLCKLFRFQSSQKPFIVKWVILVQLNLRLWDYLMSSFITLHLSLSVVLLNSDFDLIRNLSVSWTKTLQKWSVDGSSSDFSNYANPSSGVATTAEFVHRLVVIYLWTSTL